MKKKFLRIVERKYISGKIKYILQHKKFSILRWKRTWRDINYLDEEGCRILEEYNTLKEAIKNLSYYDGTRVTQKTVYYTKRN